MQTAGENFPHALTRPSLGQCWGYLPGESQPGSPPRTPLHPSPHGTSPTPEKQPGLFEPPTFHPTHSWEVLRTAAERPRGIRKKGLQTVRPLPRRGRRWLREPRILAGIVGRSPEAVLRGRVLISGEALSPAGVAQVRCPHSGWPVPPSARQRRCLLSALGVGWAQRPGAGLQGPRPSFNGQVGDTGGRGGTPQENPCSVGHCLA